MINSKEWLKNKPSVPFNYKYILLSILIGLFLLPIFIYLYSFHGSLSIEHHKWSEFGSYLSGVYGTLAFLILAYTTNITRKQFKTQNEDNVFFKLYDSLQNRIVNSSITILDSEHSAHQTLKVLAERFYEELSEEAIEAARILLIEAPEEISNVHYIKIFGAINGAGYINTWSEDRDRLIEEINGQPDFNSKWEHIKYYIGSRGGESEKVRDALRATGSVNFYTIAFSKRQQHYKNVVQRLSNEYGEFLDGYFKNICYLIEFALNSTNSDLYKSFIKSQLTKYELVILFYLIAGREDGLINKAIFQDLDIISEILTLDCQSLMIDFPSDEILRQELSNVFKQKANK